MGKTKKDPMEWFNHNSVHLGEKYRDEWLAVSGTGIDFHSNSYKEVSEFVNNQSEKELLVVKVPSKPHATYFY